MKSADLRTICAELPPPDGTLRPVSIYVSVPFCRTKCHFCDWVTDVPVRRLRLEHGGRAAYITALCDQIAHCGEWIARLGYTPKVMYWGGGTPTRLDPDELIAIRTAIELSFDLSSVDQWTVETTPDLATNERLEPLIERGLTRVSMGVQSFDDDHLRLAGRSHDSATACSAIERVKRMGVPTFNIDVIAGFPQESEQTWRRTVETAIAFDPPHVSVYPYRPTEGTVMADQLAAGHYEALDGERQIAAYDIAIDLLRAAGYHEYSHGYWVRRAIDRGADAMYVYAMRGDKLGLGSGADSLLAHHLVVNERVRYDDYLRAPRLFSYAERFSLRNPALFATILGGALMTDEGIHFERFQKLTGLSFHEARTTPFLTEWFRQLHAFGAEFIETAEGLRLPLETRHKVYIRYLTAQPILRPIWKREMVASS